MGASVLISAAASIISVNFIHPVELVKTRIQVTGLNPIVDVNHSHCLLMQNLPMNQGNNCELFFILTSKAPPSIDESLYI